MDIYKIDIIDNKNVNINNPESFWAAIPKHILEKECTIIIYGAYDMELNSNWLYWSINDKTYPNIKLVYFDGDTADYYRHLKYTEIK